MKTNLAQLSVLIFAQMPADGGGGPCGHVPADGGGGPHRQAPADGGVGPH